jgi:hypothetical protein
MTDDTHDQSGEQSAVILGRSVFERLRKQLAAKNRANRLATAAGKMAMQKRLVTRMLNRDRERPHLRVIK